MKKRELTYKLLLTRFDPIPYKFYGKAYKEALILQLLLGDQQRLERFKPFIGSDHHDATKVRLKVKPSR